MSRIDQINPKAETFALCGGYIIFSWLFIYLFIYLFINVSLIANYDVNDGWMSTHELWRRIL